MLRVTAALTTARSPGAPDRRPWPPHHPTITRSRREAGRPAHGVRRLAGVRLDTGHRGGDRRAQPRFAAYGAAGYRAMLDRGEWPARRRSAIIGPAALVRDRIAALWPTSGSPTSRRWRSAGPRRDRRDREGTQGSWLVWPTSSSRRCRLSSLPHRDNRRPGRAVAAIRPVRKRVVDAVVVVFPGVLDRNGDRSSSTIGPQVSAPIGTVNCRVSPWLGTVDHCESPSFEPGRCRRWRSTDCRVCRTRVVGTRMGLTLDLSKPPK